MSKRGEREQASCDRNVDRSFHRPDAPKTVHVLRDIVCILVFLANQRHVRLTNRENEGGQGRCPSGVTDGLATANLLMLSDSEAPSLQPVLTVRIINASTPLAKLGFFACSSVEVNGCYGCVGVSTSKRSESR